MYERYFLMRLILYSEQKDRLHVLVMWTLKFSCESNQTPRFRALFTIATLVSPTVRAPSTNVSTAFRLRNCHFFFFVFFLLFFLFQLLSYFWDVFFASLLSLTHYPPSPTPYAPHKRERPFCFAPDHLFDYSAFLAYAKSTGCFVVWNTLVASRYLCVLGVREE